MSRKMSNADVGDEKDLVEASSPLAILKKNKERFKFRFHRTPHSQLNEQLLVTLTILFSLLVFVVAPLQASGVLEGRYFGLIFGAALIPAAFMLAQNWYAAGSIVAAILIIVVASETELRNSTIVDSYLDASAWLLAGVTLTVVVSRAVFGPGKVTVRRVVGGILIYLTIGLTFVALFGIFALSLPEAFRGIDPSKGQFGIAGDLIYFSFVTLTTIGYGDITPLHPYVRGVANLEAVIGQLYPATLLARLVTLEITSQSKESLES
jgi:Ion channel